MVATRPDLDPTPAPLPQRNPPPLDEATPDDRRLRLSLSRTLTLGLSALFLASLGTSLWIAFDAAQQNTFDLQRELAELTVDSVIQEVDTHIGAAQKQVEFLSGIIARGEVAIDDEQRLTDLMVGAMAAAPQVSGVALVRADYTVLRAGLQDGKLVSLRGSWADRPQIRESLENPEVLGSATWRGITWSEDFQAPHIVVAEPVIRDGAVLGLMFSVVSVSALSGFLDAFDQANRTHSFILYGRDRVLAHPALARGFTGLSEDKPLPALADVPDLGLTAIWDPVIDRMEYLLAESPISGHVVEGGDEEFIYFYRESDIYGASPWLIGVYFLGSEVDVPLRRLIVAGTAGIIILLIAIVMSLFLARSIVRPMNGLAGASESVRRLDLDNVPPLRGSLFRELDIAVKAFDAMLAGLRRFETYVPKSLVLRLMRSGGSSVESEEREITVLFTDIVDFTRIGSELPPGGLAAMLNDHFTLLGAAIDDEEGTVDKYIGDSIMAFWGAPLDQPDHAARACRAARGMARRIAADNARRATAGEAPIHLRVGIHSGLAVVGNIGAPGRVNYTLVGDTVNIAQRLEGLGKETAPDAACAVLLSADTRAGLDEDFGVEALGSFTLRGREAPLEVYRLELSTNPSGRE